MGQTGRLLGGPAWPCQPGKQSTGQTEPRRLNKQRAFDIFEEVAANREVFDEEENVLNMFSSADNLWISTHTSLCFDDRRHQALPWHDLVRHRVAKSEGEFLLMRHKINKAAYVVSLPPCPGRYYPDHTTLCCIISVNISSHWIINNTTITHHKTSSSPCCVVHDMRGFCLSVGVEDSHLLGSLILELVPG